MDAFEQLPPRAQQPVPFPQYHYWETPAGEMVATFHRSPTGFFLRFLDRADFTIDSRCEAVTCTPVPGFSQEIVSALFHNQVVPLMLGHKGHLVLHGSGVASPCGAIGFVGATGLGKSTLAAAFARAGYPFITDDGLLLAPLDGGYLATPNNPRFRLRPDSELALFGEHQPAIEADSSAKRPIPASEAVPFQESPVRLQAIYLLGPGETETTRISAMSPADALMALIAHSFILDVDDSQQVRGNFDRLAELSATQPCFRLDYPRRYDYLPQAIADILEHAGRDRA